MMSDISARTYRTETGYQRRGLRRHHTANCASVEVEVVETARDVAD